MPNYCRDTVTLLVAMNYCLVQWFLTFFGGGPFFSSQKLWRAKHIGFCQFRNLCSAIHYLATTFFSPTCPKLGGPFMNVPRAIFGLFLTIYPFLRPRTTSLHGEKNSMLELSVAGHFGPRLRGLAGHLPRHRGPFLVRGPGVKNH